MGRYLLMACGIASLLFFSCSAKKDGSVAARPRGPVQADGFLVQPTSVSETVEVPGTLLPEEETDIRAEVSGRVVRLDIPEGGVVQKGKLLVKLFDGDLQAQLRKLEVQLQIAQKSEERQAELLKINGISQQDYDLAQLNVENLKADIEATRIAISKTEIRSPYRGTLGLRQISLGSYLSPNDIVTSIRQVDRLKLEFAIPEKYAKAVGPGDKVRFRVDGGDQWHEATVMATENSVDEATRTLTVRALVREKHRELVPGVFAKVNLQLGRTDNALMIPTQAVIPQARGKQVILYSGDSIRFREVETGIRDSAYVQITRGLEAGDTVIISGLMAIRPTSTVRLDKILTHE
ncbi:MAG TPA: efflux RND transporter periplasmic adaptor subunit [Cyclobacteriaceae bacterium]